MRGAKALGIESNWATPLLLWGEHRIPRWEKDWLLLKKLEDILWHILALNNHAEHILVEPLVGHNQVTLIAR